MRQNLGNVSPLIEPATLSVPIDETIDLSASNTMDASAQFDQVGTSDIEQEMVDASNASLLSPESENNELADEEDEREIMSPGEEERLPLHEGGERDDVDSDDSQSAGAESYNDDQATTDEEPVVETAPYNEPEEFADGYDEEGSRTAPENPNKTIELDDEPSYDADAQSAEAFEDDYGKLWRNLKFLY
jgi:hypothetical protein